MAAVPPPVPKTSLAEEQARLLSEMKTKVARESFQMKRAVDAENLKDALKHASAMLNELRTAALTPKNYYDLYMEVFDQLSFLEMFFMTLHRNGTPMAELYQMVQQAGNVVTRLYLLVTVGGVFIRSKAAPAKDILTDLVEMAKGVQQPMRGLFLRYYLSQKTKDKLPDLGSEYEGAGGSVEDAVSFILQNFGEMTRLWVRMQSSNVVRNRKRRERERQELCVLVGSNLDRLSRLDGLTLAMYQSVVLPNILEQVANSNDKIAQFYLIEATIQAFPDEFHINTLGQLLEGIESCLPEVDVKSLAVNLMTRIADYARTANAENHVSGSDSAAGGSSGGVIPVSIDAFHTLRAFCDRICKARAESMSAVARLELLAGLLDFTAQCYPNDIANIDSVLASAAAAMDGASSRGALDADASAVIVRLLTLPLQSLSMRVLRLVNFPALMGVLRFDDKRAIARKVLSAVIQARTKLESAVEANQLLVFLAPVVRDVEGTPSEEADSKSEFEEEQHACGRLLYLIHNDSTDDHFRILSKVREHLGCGGTRRTPFTLPPLLFSSLRLLHRVVTNEAAGRTSEVTAKKLLQFCHEICTALALSHPEIALKLFVQSGIAADKIGFSYEFFSQAFTLAELLDSAGQVRATSLLIASLRAINSVENEGYENLITRVAKLSSRLLMKADQSRLVSDCCQLFWRTDLEGRGQRPEQVMPCLKMALTTADEAMPKPVACFTHILDHAVRLFETGCPKVTGKFVSGLIGLTRDHVAAMATGPAKATVEAHFASILRHIEIVRASKHAAIYAEVAF